MAQQQQRRDEFANAPTTQDRDHDDVRKNDQSDRMRDEFGTGAATDPVAQYAYYGTTVAAGHGAPAIGVPPGAYGMPNYGTNVGATCDTAGYDTTTGFPGFGTTMATGYGTTGGGAGQWGQDATAGGGGGGDLGMDMNRDMDMNVNKGRDQK